MCSAVWNAVCDSVCSEVVNAVCNIVCSAVCNAVCNSVCSAVYNAVCRVCEIQYAVQCARQWRLQCAVQCALQCSMQCAVQCAVQCSMQCSVQCAVQCTKSWGLFPCPAAICRPQAWPLSNTALHWTSLHCTLLHCTVHYLIDPTAQLWVMLLFNGELCRDLWEVEDFCICCVFAAKYRPLSSQLYFDGFVFYGCWGEVSFSPQHAAGQTGGWCRLTQSAAASRENGREKLQL